MREKTQEDLQRQKNLLLIRDILGDSYISFSYERLHILEESGGTEVRFKLQASDSINKPQEKSITGMGKGLIDAMFKALMLEYVDDCVSVSMLKVEEFYIFVDRADLYRLIQRGKSGASAGAEACLMVDNGTGGVIPFRSYNKSVVAAMAEVVLCALEFFINSEMAVRSLRLFIEDAKSRRRSDLVDLYTYKMADLVKNTSYVESLRGDK